MTRRFRRGFTLLEVLVSMVIFSVGIMAIMQLFPHTLRMARLATERLPTAAEANRQLSALRARGLAGSRDTLGWPLSISQPVLTDGGEIPSTMQYTVQPLGRPDTRLWKKEGLRAHALQRVTLDIPMSDGKYVKFVTFVSKY